MSFYRISRTRKIAFKRLFIRCIVYFNLGVFIRNYLHCWSTLLREVFYDFSFHFFQIISNFGFDKIELKYGAHTWFKPLTRFETWYKMWEEEDNKDDKIKNNEFLESIEIIKSGKVFQELLIQQGSIIVVLVCQVLNVEIHYVLLLLII